MNKVLSKLKDVASDLSELYIPTRIESVDLPISDRELFLFYRTFVQKNIPVKIRGCLDSWPALTKWNSDDYLLSVLKDATVTAAITPNGLADAIVHSKFTLPFERKMQFQSFLSELRDPREDRVLYLQKQNDSFNSEFQCLMHDVDPDPSWMRTVFGTQLAAVNFWMGDKRAITSLHKDPFENMYSVVRGEKTFTLFPPCDRAHLRYTRYPVYKYREDGSLQPEESEEVPWVDVDQIDPLATPGLSDKTHPLRVTVSAGETLYLPSYWFHHVTQTHATIAMNYWYDIDYGPAYGVFQTFDEIARVCENGIFENGTGDF